jgi:hypothetical protein
LLDYFEPERVDCRQVCIYELRFVVDHFYE